MKIRGGRLHRVQSSETRPFLATDWEHCNHHEARDLLHILGWSRFARGDWAYAYESPSRQLVARVAPFDPGYQFFVELCSRCQGNPHLPDIQLASKLEGGGHLSVMEHLKPADPAVIASFEHLWERPDQADDQLRVLRREVEAMDRWGKRHKRWWVGVDIGDRHILLSEAGTPKVIDLFGLGTPMLNDLINDPVEFSRHISPDECRYLLDMPDLQDPSHPAEYLLRLPPALSTARTSTAR